MTPSLPIDLPTGTLFIEVADPLSCAMVRFGLPCGGDAYHTFLCPQPGGCYQLIPVCFFCMESSPLCNGRTWVGDLELWADQARKEANNHA